MPIKKKITRALTKRSQQKRFSKIKTSAKKTRLKKAMAPGAPNRRLRRKLVASKIKKGLAIGGGIGAGVGVGYGVGRRRRKKRRK